MKKMLLVSASALALMSVAAAAGQPANPGAFGRDRAAAIHAYQDDATSPGASEWGHIAAERAGTNGQLNRDYRDQNGGTPTHGSDQTTTGDGTTTTDGTDSTAGGTDTSTVY